MKNYIKYHTEYIKKNYGIDIINTSDLDKLSDTEIRALQKYIHGFYDGILALKKKIKETIND